MKNLSIRGFLFAVVFVIFLPFSCKKDLTDKPEESLDLLAAIIEDGGEPPVESYFLLHVTQTANPVPNATNSIHINSATAVKENGNLIDVGPVSINGLQLEHHSNNIYSTEYHLSDTLFTIGNSYVGNDIDVRIAGNTNLAIENRLIRTYVPKYMFTSPYDMPTTILSKSAGVNLKWQPDPLNISGKVFIQVYYYKGISQSYNPAFPNNVASVVFTKDDRDGSFKIPASAFSNYPVGSYLGISMGRGVQYVKSIKDPSMPPKNVYYFNIVEAKTIPILVNQ